MCGGEARWLLIGNSRWHWAADTAAGRRYWSEPPAAAVLAQPRQWAAVGPVPPGLAQGSRIQLAQIPLAAAPAWLGIDRALAGHEAWCRSQGPVLVADAGTALSLTRVDRAGRFGGGRLMAGAALQWRALHQGTQALPPLQQTSLLDGAAQPAWPAATEAAMAVGVLEGLAGALQRAAAQLQQQEPGLRLWLTGGDGPALLPLLKQDGACSGQPWQLAPGLCLDGLARVAGLSSGPNP